MLISQEIPTFPPSENNTVSPKENLHITPTENHQDNYHCVFSNSHKDRPDSIILSAYFPDGTCIETVEYSLTHHKVIQCRGAYNLNSSLHDRIINLVNANPHRFIEAQPKTA